MSKRSESAEQKVLEKLVKNEVRGGVTTAELRTDDRVLARVSDGIYRQPGAAIRELIANSYDADATRVEVDMDPPRFGRITVRDNGRGMSKEQLVRLIHHIGGSSKRTDEGRDLGTTDAEDSLKSPGGRRLIGKIGIGLFSVSQLTRQFRIITKQKGEAYRLVADIKLQAYSEPLVNEEAGGSTKTGSVSIQSVKAKKSEHGTEIILDPIQPAAKDFLCSKDIWQRVNRGDGDADVKFAPPPFHVGRVDPETQETILHSAELPWSPGEGATKRFRSLYDAVVRERMKRNANPKLEAALDRYLHTLWTLSLSVPLAYLDGAHPFDLPASKLPSRIFKFSNKKGGRAEEVKLKDRETLRDRLNLGSLSPSNFVVVVDGVELRRPLRLETPDEVDSRRKPILFVGQWQPPLEAIPVEVSGGRELSIEGYMLWMPKIVPVDHNGVLVRIADASGTVFDPTFFSYQVAERTRLGQVTSELFATRGLDAALNIDRESFNFGHPHAKMLAEWVHSSLRQLATATKRIQSEQRAASKAEGLSQLQKDVWKIVRRASPQTRLEKVQLVDSEQIPVARGRGDAVLDRAKILPVGGLKGGDREALPLKVQAIATLLSDMGLLEQLDYSEQEELLAAIAKIIQQK